MKPIDYIYKNLGHLNMTVLKQLITDAGETVSEEIYDYLKETPWNTNTAILKEMGLDIKSEALIKKVYIYGAFGTHVSNGTLGSKSDIKNVSELWNYLKEGGEIELYGFKEQNESTIELGKFSMQSLSESSARFSLGLDEIIIYNDLITTTNNMIF